MDKMIYVNNLFLRIIKKILSRFEKKDYITKISNKWVFVSYIVKPLYNKESDRYLSEHQNRRETIEIFNIFSELNYSSHFTHYKEGKVPSKKFDIVFGLEPNFIEACKKNPKALKIYYATGAYYKHQNKMVKKLTDDFNSRYNTNVPYRRLAIEHDSCQVADYIIQVGNINTLETYPKKFRDKIFLIRQTTNVFYKDFNLNNKFKSSTSKNYIWFGSNGNLLKGLDLVIQAFSKRVDLNLHIIGPIEIEIQSIYKNKLSEYNNINFYGFLDIKSELFKSIVDKCIFVIFPTGSEGHPGSIINLQKVGMIPLVSKWAAVKEIEQLGYKMNNISVQDVHKALDWADKLSENELQILMSNNVRYANTEHGENAFNNRFKSILNEIIN